MYKKILFCTCLTQYCEHIFRFSLNMAKENNAKLWIYNGVGRLNLSREETLEEIGKAEARVKEAYVDEMKSHGFDNYSINVSDGDVVSEIVKLARDASVDIVVMGTDTKVPIQTGEDVRVGPLGSVTMDTLLWSPCPVLVIPPALVPGLAMR
jgi:nucleotide-binding universal stress UspA family protein